MNDFVIRPTNNLDFQSILALNQAAVKATSELALKDIQQLDLWSCYHKVITIQNKVVAFLVVLPKGKPYQSLNYRWFENAYESFYYVDRIVVDPKFAGKKLGSKLYKDLFNEARNTGIDRITCEINSQPMNKASQAFHQSMGFKEVGRQWLNNRSKQVSLQVLHL